MLDATPLLRLYAAARLRRLARMAPAEAQRRMLLALVRRAARTRFGRDHDFARIRTVEDFQARVPLRRYEDFWAQYWQPAFPVLADVTWPGTIPYFAATSGTTTGKTKYIPVSRAMTAANKWAVFDLLTFHAAARPASRVLGGRSFMLGGSTQMRALAPGVYAGDLSGIAAREVPAWARPLYFPPPELARIADWEAKVDALAPRSLAEDIRVLGGTASWLLLFIDRLKALRPGTSGRLAEYYPRCELVVHGGVNFAPYRPRYERLLEGSRAELREVYPASEGFIAVADRGTGEGLRPILDNGLFFEFVPVEELGAARPRRHWIGTAERGVNYAIVLSSCAGAWGYVLGDTVRLVDLDPPRLLVTGRTAYTLSAFGEHLIGEEIEQAVAAAAQAIGAAVVDFAVGPVFSEGGASPGGHLYIVEFDAGPPEPPRLAAFARALDARLCALNADYKDHRAERFGIAPPRVAPMPPGGFALWMKRRGKLGGQNKVPRVVTDAALLDSLRAAAGAC